MIILKESFTIKQIRTPDILTAAVQAAVIPRARISTLLDALEFFAKTEQEFDPDAAWDVLSKLDSSRFYLLKEDVERANTAKLIGLDRIKSAREAEVTGTLMGYILPSVPDFSVSPEMSDAYYKTEG